MASGTGSIVLFNAPRSITLSRMRTSLNFLLRGQSPLVDSRRDSCLSRRDTTSLARFNVPIVAKYTYTLICLASEGHHAIAHA